MTKLIEVFLPHPATEFPAAFEQVRREKRSQNGKEKKPLLFPLDRAVIESLIELGEPRQLVLPPCPACGDNRVVMARQVRKEDAEADPIFAEFLRRRRQQQQQEAMRKRQNAREESEDSANAGENEPLRRNPSRTRYVWRACAPGRASFSPQSMRLITSPAPTFAACFLSCFGRERKGKEGKVGAWVLVARVSREPEGEGKGDSQHEPVQGRRPGGKESGGRRPCFCLGIIQFLSHRPEEGHGEGRAHLILHFFLSPRPSCRPGSRRRRSGAGGGGGGSSAESCCDLATAGAASNEGAARRPSCRSRRRSSRRHSRAGSGRRASSAAAQENDVRASRNGSNGRANSVHSLKNNGGEETADGGVAEGEHHQSEERRRTYHPAFTALIMRPSELYFALRKRWDGFTYDRRNYSLWIFKPEDKWVSISEERSALLTDKNLFLSEFAFSAKT